VYNLYSFSSGSQQKGSFPAVLEVVSSRLLCHIITTGAIAAACSFITTGAGTATTHSNILMSVPPPLLPLLLLLLLRQLKT
jgi:hypothetical protein